ncbi:hypothetical protein TrRE_jg7878, partial [Triparma retinervis]
MHLSFLTTHSSIFPVSSATLLPTSLASAAKADNLVAGVAEISIGFSVGTLWSEYAVAITGCGPIDFNDSLERLCYLGVLASASSVVFTKIVTNSSLSSFLTSKFYPDLLPSTVVQMRVAEWLSLFAVASAFVVLTQQHLLGTHLSGLSGIDPSKMARRSSVNAKIDKLLEESVRERFEADTHSCTGPRAERRLAKSRLYGIGGGGALPRVKSAKMKNASKAEISAASVSSPMQGSPPGSPVGEM